MAVVTGGGTGMKRTGASTRRKWLPCSDLRHKPRCMEETSEIALAGTQFDVRLTTHLCGVSDEADVLAFVTNCKLDITSTSDLVFNNEEWRRRELRDRRRSDGMGKIRCLLVSVYYGSRVFLPMSCEAKVIW